MFQKRLETSSMMLASMIMVAGYLSCIADLASLIA